VSDPARLEELRAEARYRHERYDLYRARAYGPHATSTARLRELQRAWQAAEDRLQAAGRNGAPGPEGAGC
jgi:hypothetical protein